MRVLRILLSVALLSGLAACGSSTPRAGGRVNIVAAENFYGDIAAQLGGDRVHVRSLINDPEADPHLYESSAGDASVLAGARVVIKNGLGYDDFVDKLLATTGRSDRIVITIADVLGVRGNNANPHLWYDIPRVPDVARAIVEQLAKTDPAGAQAYEANLRTFDASLQPLNDAIEQIKTRYPHAPVAFTERVAGSLLAAAGLEVKSPPGFAAAIEDGNEPNAADTAAMDDLMTHHGVKVLLYNSQAESPVTQHVRDLAQQNGIPVVGVSETMPRKEQRYQDWQLEQVRALLAALGS
jgi:zinc/manganese transport system substrate-binding protein